MTRSLKIYQGEDQTPVRDLTEPSSNVHVIWEEVEAGHRAYQVESSSSSFPMRDEEGESGSELNLPGGLTHISLSAHNVLEWIENVGDANETVMFRGRVGPKDYSRGRQKADRAREVTVNAQDGNFDLRGIIVDGWVRGAETDVARVQALVADYLQGDPRVTTNISTTYVAAGSNTVSLPAQRYDSTSPEVILRDLATLANKLAFVTIDNELFYDGHDSTAYQAGVRISDREDEIDTDGVCGSVEDAVVGSACSDSGVNILSDYAPWAGDYEERVEITSGVDCPAGSSIVAWVSTNIDGGEGGLYDHQVYDEQGNTWTLDSTSPDQGSQDIVVEIWHCNVTNPIEAGDYIRFAMNVGPSINPETEIGQRCIGAHLFGGTLSSPTVGTEANGFSSTPTVASSATGDLVVAGIHLSNSSATLSGDADWSNAVDTSIFVGPGSDELLGQYLIPGANESWTPVWTGGSNDWTITTVGYTRSESEDGEGLPTFPPIWDVGPSSTEDGLQLLSGLRLYYGQGSNTYVYVSDPTTANKYSHYEESLFTSDPAINTAARATVLAQSILDRRRREERTYNVSIGPLTEDQVACVKAGQLINIKARAIPDADDMFVSRRIAQLRWTTPVPGLFFAHMQLDRPIKEVPHDVGPRQAFEVSDKHVLQGSNSHPDLVPKAVLSSQGDLPYRGASDWTRLAIGASNTYLKSTGQVPTWATIPGVGSAAAEDVSITDAGGYFTGTDVEAALQEIGAGTAGGATLDASHLLTAIPFPIIAHRGDMNPVDGYPENTLEAIRQACTRGAHGVEIDVIRDSDGVFQVIHDTTVTRTTDGTGNVSSKTTVQMAALNIDGGYGYDAGRHGTSLNVPTLDEAVEVMLPYDVVIYFDLKESSDAAHEALAQYIIDNDLGPRSILLGLTVSGLQAAHDIAPNVEMQIPASIDDDPQNYDYIDRVLSEESVVTSAAYVNTRNPDPVDTYVEADTQYGDDELEILTAMWGYGVRAYLTNDLPNALRYRNNVVLGVGKWEAVTDGEDVFVWEGDDLVHEWSS